MAILDASCISVEGESIEQCYDEQGRLYNVPQFLFTHPRPPKKNKDSNEAKGENSKESKFLSGSNGGVQGVPLTLQVRINPGEIKVEINTNSADTVHTLKSLVEEQTKSLMPAAGSASVSCCLLYTSPSPRDATLSRMPSSA